MATPTMATQMMAAPAVVGLAFDQLLGEPPLRFHPVARFGTLMTGIEQRLYKDRRVNGVLFTAIGVGVGVSVGVVLRRLFGPRLATAIATGFCSAGHMLDSEASGVADLLRPNDFDLARHRLQSLVGRTTDDLNEAGISRAVIESVAENSVDAVIASLFWAATGGAPAVLAHRCANTLDAMVGHHNNRYEHFGWASARFDDAINFIPARLGALAVALCRPRRAKAIYETICRDAAQHPSPNGGVIEAAYAAALNVQLGGVNFYGDATEDRGTLGNGPLPNKSTITQAVALRRHSTATAAALVLAIGLGAKQLHRVR